MDDAITATGSFNKTKRRYPRAPARCPINDCDGIEETIANAADVRLTHAVPPQQLRHGRAKPLQQLCVRTLGAQNDVTREPQHDVQELVHIVARSPRLEEMP